MDKKEFKEITEKLEKTDVTGGKEEGGAQRHIPCVIATPTSAELSTQRVIAAPFGTPKKIPGYSNNEEFYFDFSGGDSNPN